MSFLNVANCQQIDIKVVNQKDTTAFLVKYFGKGKYLADTSTFKKGKIRFDLSNQKSGMFGLYMPGKPILDFIYVGESFTIETDLSHVIDATKTKNSIDNTIHYAYLRKLNALKKEADSASKEDAIKIRNQFLVFRDSLIQVSKGLFVGKIMQLFTEVELPDSLKMFDEGETSAVKRYQYYQNHYWDRVDFKDDRLVRTNAFHPLLENYFSKSMMIQHCDTIIYYAFKLCDQLPKSSDFFQYCVSWITTNFSQSDIMGMDKVYVAMAERYYCNSQNQNDSHAYWMLSDEKQKGKLMDLCEKVAIQKNLVLGVKPPNIILRDTTDQQWIDFYSLPNKYTILYFWDPDCGHCKKMTPALQRLYSSKLKRNDVEIFAVGNAVGEDFEKWKDFIRLNALEFINVAVTDQLYKQASENAGALVPIHTTLESLNYQQTYDIYSTPKIWILDKDKKIIAKGLSVEQLESFFDTIFSNQ